MTYTWEQTKKCYIVNLDGQTKYIYSKKVLNDMIKQHGSAEKLPQRKLNPVSRLGEVVQEPSLNARVIHENDMYYVLGYGGRIVAEFTNKYQLSSYLNGWKKKSTH